jgi:hypothetical protein
MINKKHFSCLSPVLLLWCHFSYGISNSELSVDISAESVPRVAVYYMGSPVPDTGLDFPLTVNGISQKFERTSSDFHIVGNVEQADIVFEDAEFVLPQMNGGNRSISLSGNFVFNGAEISATKILRVPVLDNISQGAAGNGVKVKFISEFTAGNYTKGDYANIFTLIVTPVI